MALVHKRTHVKWSGGDTVAVGAGASQESDVITSDPTAVAARLQIKANNGGTPAPGDEITVRVLYTKGDVDEDAGGDEYDTPVSARTKVVLDTNGENPAIASVPISIPSKGFKVRVTSGASTNSITCSAQVMEQTAS